MEIVLLSGASAAKPVIIRAPHIAPPFPTVVERLVRTILPWRIAPAQAVAIDEDNAVQDTPSLGDA